jgi:hypothetical protein
MANLHLKPMSKSAPASACGSYMDGSLFGKLQYRKCVKGKLPTMHQ